MLICIHNVYKVIRAFYGLNCSFMIIATYELLVQWCSFLPEFLLYLVLATS